ncbi:hypothetical protein CLOSTASPAR_05253 [[Clostridium] asparagiforme DSM 15981]|uniref:Uncharacterized protein n=1 Tax=[Clostridium] asparagiforme DSM 15981 TaxID=518636 RepID=C0D7K6_9FIRM|nr:hypothetical protein CLOSTASPAR_05253 [[Clostridium] asparagiforme DSM 15981]
MLVPMANTVQPNQNKFQSNPKRTTRLPKPFARFPFAGIIRQPPYNEISDPSNHQKSSVFCYL